MAAPTSGPARSPLQRGPVQTRKSFSKGYFIRFSVSPAGRAGAEGGRRQKEGERPVETAKRVRGAVLEAAVRDGEAVRVVWGEPEDGIQDDCPLQGRGMGGIAGTLARSDEASECDG